MKTARQNLNESRNKTTWQIPIPLPLFNQLEESAKAAGLTVDQLGSQCIREYLLPKWLNPITDPICCGSIPIIDPTRRGDIGIHDHSIGFGLSEAWKEVIRNQTKDERNETLEHLLMALAFVAATSYRQPAGKTAVKAMKGKASR